MADPKAKKTISAVTKAAGTVLTGGKTAFVGAGKPIEVDPSAYSTAWMSPANEGAAKQIQAELARRKEAKK